MKLTVLWYRVKKMPILFSAQTVKFANFSTHPFTVQKIFC